MRTTINKVTLIAGVLIITIMILNGCRVDHSLNPNKWGRVYMYQALNNPVSVSALTNYDTTETVVYGAAYGGPKRSGGDISVNFNVDPSYVDSFNIKNLTSYTILPKKCYSLSNTSGVIPFDKKATPPFQITINGKVSIPEGQYLLPITVQINRGRKEVDSGRGIQVNPSLQTAYFLITVHKFMVVAENHDYTTVFSDSARYPDYLFFLGTPKDSTHEMVWKYDLKGNSLAPGFPKRVTDVFNISYPQTIPKITTGVWVHFNPSDYFYIFGNGHYYSYNISTKTAGALHPIDDLSTNPWPLQNFPKHIQAGFWAPFKAAMYYFIGDQYEKQHVGPLRAWFYPLTSHGVNDGFPGIPSDFIQQGFSGAYYDRNTRTVHFFSRNEFVVYNFTDPIGVVGGVQKIQDVYKGL